MAWLKRPTVPAVENLTHLLEPGWDGGKVTAGHTGGVVTLTAENLTREEDGTGWVALLILPGRLQPFQRLLGQRMTFRGREVRIDQSGTVLITDPRAIADHLDVTYVAKGGA